MKKLYLAVFASVVSTMPLQAADLEAVGNPDLIVPERIRLLGGVGYASLSAEEFVYDDADNRISQLFWESDVPVVTAAAEIDLGNNWGILANVAVGLNGDSHMVDYDWLDAAPSYAFDDWSDRSEHSNTDLEHYFTGDIALGRNFSLVTSSINLHAGFKYTDVKWASYGGSYVYSENGGYRNETGTEPEGQRAISYRQKLPGVFIGARAQTRISDLTLTGQARGGVTINAQDHDWHWQTNTRFDDEFDPLPFISLSARAEYAVAPLTSIFMAASYDRYFHNVGDVVLSNIDDGMVTDSDANGAGAELEAVTISGGLSVRF